MGAMNQNNRSKNIWVAAEGLVCKVAESRRVITSVPFDKGF